MKVLCEKRMNGIMTKNYSPNITFWDTTKIKTPRLMNYYFGIQIMSLICRVCFVGRVHLIIH